MATYYANYIDQVAGLHHYEVAVAANLAAGSVIARVDMCWSMGNALSADGIGTVEFVESPAIGLEIVNNGAGAYDISAGYAYGTTVGLHGHGPATPAYSLSPTTVNGMTAEVPTGTKTWRGYRRLNAASDLWFAVGQPGNQQNTRIFKGWCRVTVYP